MSEGITAREELPSGIAHAALVANNKPANLIKFFIKPRGNTPLDAKIALRVNPVYVNCMLWEGGAGQTKVQAEG